MSGPTETNPTASSESEIQAAPPAAESTDAEITLIEELRALARSRSALQFSETAAPALDEVVRARDLPRTEGRQLVLDEAIDAIGYPQYRDAAHALLGSGPDRWQALTQRGEGAAAQFGIGYDGFRRARKTGPSLLDETLAIVARGILQPPSDDERPPAAPTVTQLSEDGEPPRRRPLLLAGAAVAFVLIVVAIALIATRPDDSEGKALGSTDTAAPSSALDASSEICTIGPPDISGHPDLVGYAEVFETSATEVATDPANGCPTGGLQQWDAFVFQQFAADGQNTGVLASTDPTQAIWFTEAQWGSYHQVGGKSGDNAQALMGIAQAPEQRDGYVVIPTDTNAILVGETPNSPHFFLLGPARATWEAAGGADGPLGLPTSNPVVIGGALTQDFEGGYLEQLPDASVVSHLVEDPAADLPPIQELEGKIVRHADATSWYIAPDGLRYWIPNGEVWDCLGGAGAQIDNNIRGYAIATLTYGGPATC